jgi:thiamine pyrophosphokinase
MSKKDTLKEKLKQANQLLLAGPLSVEKTCLNNFTGPKIAVDGGRFHLPPEAWDYTIGDDDSSPADLNEKKRYKLDETHSPNKDQSDFALALDLIPNSFVGEIHAHGLWGGRMDHFLAIMGEVQLFLTRNPHIQFMFYENDKVHLWVLSQTVKSLTLKGRFSVFTLTPQHISLQGQIDYPCDKKFLPLHSLGLSNHAFGKFQISCEAPAFIFGTTS